VKAVSWLRQSVTGLSLWRPVSVHVRFVVVRVAMGQVFSELFGFPLNICSVVIIFRHFSLYNLRL
jgi:hypothetical protein